jgi:hypothetical protein
MYEQHDIRKLVHLSFPLQASTAKRRPAVCAAQEASYRTDERQMFLPAVDNFRLSLDNSLASLKAKRNSGV